MYLEMFQLIRAVRNSGVVYKAANWDNADVEIGGTLASTVGVVSFYLNGVSTYAKIGSLGEQRRYLPQIVPLQPEQL